MKPQQLAKLLNVSPVTLRHWCASEFGQFLSPSAQGNNGAKRSFSDIDARILAWIAVMRAQNTPFRDITTTLRASQADGWRNLPPLPGGIANDEPIAVVPREAVEERITALEERFRLQIAMYEERLKAVESERLELKEENAELKAENAALRRQQMELTGQIVALSTKLVDLRNRRKK